MLLYLLNNTIKEAVPTGSGFVAPGLLLWSGATKRDLGKLQLAQDRAARLALNRTRRANINDKHVSLSCLKVEERLTSSLLVFVRDVDKLKVPRCLFKILAHRSDTHAYPTRHATRGLFTVPKSRTDYVKCTVLLYIEQ